MVEIKAGRELDRAVAEAIGNTGSPHPEGYMGPSLPVPFLPSTDLNAAFSAAEAAKLFDYYYLLHGENEWEILEHCDAPFDGAEVFVAAPTVALAICAAILAYKNADRMSGNLDVMGDFQGNTYSDDRSHNDP